MRVIIVGGVAGGMSTATRLRRLDADAEIIVLERSGHVSYANCGLPYFVGGVIEDEADLLLQTPESLHDRFRLDVRVGHEVTAIDTLAKAITVRNVTTAATQTLTYDALVLSPGASPVIPPIPGVERAHPLRTVEDVESLAQAAAESRYAAVIGGGFVGLEVAENLAHRGIAVTLIEAADQVLAPLDPEMADLVLDELVRHDVDVRLGAGVSAVGVDTVELADGSLIPADLVVVAIGVRPDVALARAAAIEIGPRGGIVVDGHGRTSAPGVYAVGDAVEKTDALDGNSMLVPLANIANRAGRIVADHIAGEPANLAPSIGTAIVKVFDLTVATTGWNVKRLAAANRAYTVIHSHPGSHAGYYPGATRMALTLIFDPRSGEILGAQAVGQDGVDKRIDVISTAIYGRIQAPELANLELAYAPPFGSAKDPVNMLGYMAGNILSGQCQPIQYSEVGDRVAQGFSLVDVRTDDEFALGSIPGSINIPLDDLRQCLGDLPDGPLIVTCQVGQRGHTATMLLTELGYEAVNLDGGYETWVHSPAARAARQGDEARPERSS